jgi:F-type H+-transporting ATPase subunit b
MELFAVFGINYKLLLFQVFNFGLLLLALWYFLYAPVMKMLENRRAIVEKGVRDADVAEHSLLEADKKRKEIVAQALRDADGVVVSARSHAKEEAAEIVRSAEVRAEADLEEAKKRALEEKDKMLSDAKQEMAKMIVLGVEKVLKDKQGDIQAI